MIAGAVKHYIAEANSQTGRQCKEIGFAGDDRYLASFSQDEVFERPSGTSLAYSIEEGNQGVLRLEKAARTVRLRERFYPEPQPPDL